MKTLGGFSAALIAGIVVALLPTPEGLSRPAQLVLAVTDRAFGWGFRARLDDEQQAAFGVP